MSGAYDCPMCTQACSGCSNCLTVAPQYGGGGGGFTMYSRMETMIVSNGSSSSQSQGQSQGFTRGINGSGNFDDVRDRASQLSVASPSNARTSRRHSSSAVPTLQRIGEDSVVNTQSPTRLALPAPPTHRPDGRSMASSSTRRSSTSRLTSRNMDPHANQDSRSVITSRSITPSESISRVSTRHSEAPHGARRDYYAPSGHAASRVSGRARDIDTSTVRGPRPKDSSSRVASSQITSSRAPSRHRDERSTHGSRAAPSVTSPRRDAITELTSLAAEALRGVSEAVGQRSSRRASRDDRSHAPSRR